MGFLDLIIFPIFLLLANLYFRRSRKKIADPTLQAYHKKAFWIKIFSCIAFTIYSGYLSPGDSIGLYQKEGLHLYQLILKDGSNFKWILKSGKYFDETLSADLWNRGYFKSDANFIIIKMVAMLSFVTFGSYAANNLIFACFAFAGIWKLFHFFNNQRPKLHKRFALAILYFPTLVFWSSGVMKDPVCIACVGILTFCGYELLYYRRGIIGNSIMTAIAVYLLATIKIYILLSYLPFFIFFIVLKYLEKIQIKFFRYMIAPVFVVACVYAFSLILDSYEKELGGLAISDIAESIEHMNNVYNSKTGDGTADSNFDLGVKFDGTTDGLIRVAPVAIFTTFYRPFIWESRKISSLMAGLECFILLGFTIFLLIKCGIRRFIVYLITDSLLLYCLLFSLTFAVFIGASTLNFGTLVRYKIPCLPFFVIFLLLLHEKVKESSLKKKTRFQMVQAIPDQSISPSFA